MKHPVIALVWECWRLSRRWYLWVLPAIIGIDLFFMSRAERVVFAPAGAPRPDAAFVNAMMGYNVFFMNSMIALFTTLLAISIGNRAGFPLAFEFRLPIRTSLLLSVPMLTLAALCCSLYFLPLLLCAVLYGIEFPLLPGSALIGTLVVMLLASNWSTTSPTARTLVTFFMLFNAAQLFALLDPLDLANDLPRRGRPFFDPEVLALTPAQYGLLAGICLGLFGLALAALRKQRYGETVIQGFQARAFSQRRDAKAAGSTLLERASDLLVFACPVSAPWRAELWLELKRQGIPLLLLSLLLALAVPLLFALGINPQSLGGPMDFVFPLGVFFAGVGIAIFNRRQGTAGYMSAFEGTRGMSTTTLALLQMAAIGASLLCGIGLVCLSVYFASGMLEMPGGLALRLQALVANDADSSALLMLTSSVMQLVVFLSVILLFACVHAWSVVWGRILPYGAGIAAAYGLIFAFRVQNGYSGLESLKQHMWGLAIVILLLTVIAFGRTLHLKILSLRASVASLSCWAAFVACSLYSLAQHGIVVASQAPELRALNTGLLLLPLTLVVLLLWSYDRLRHR